MLYTIEDEVVGVRLKRDGVEDVDKELDLVATYTAMMDMADPEQTGAEWLAKLQNFFQRALDVDVVTPSQATQLQGVLQTEYERWKKKLPLEQVWHLSTDSIPTSLTDQPALPCGPTCPDSEPGGNSSSG